MKLNVVPAKTGTLWVRQGIRAFWKQPLALTGLFFMFMASMSILSIVPVLGSFLALMLLPAATLGLMAATREVELGKFPMPFILAAGFRTGADGKRNMVVLGLIYALCFVGVMGLSTDTIYSFSWLFPARKILFTMFPSFVTPPKNAPKNWLLALTPIAVALD